MLCNTLCTTKVYTCHFASNSNALNSRCIHSFVICAGYKLNVLYPALGYSQHEVKYILQAGLPYSTLYRHKRVIKTPQQNSLRSANQQHKQ